MTATAIHGDCLEEMAKLGLSRFDSMVTDPPYGLKFMGKVWDKGVPGPMFWAQALRVVKPGGYLLAFGGTRTFHRLTGAIEDAGWEIHDCLCWLYGSGFPKHESKLKPAWEPIVMARRPASEATALNIDACRLDSPERVPGGGGSPPYRYYGDNPRPFQADHVRVPTPPSDKGRWPANVIVDEEAAAALDEQSGTLRSGANPRRRSAAKFDGIYNGWKTGTEVNARRDTDSGGASRFYYCAKASHSERNAGCEAFDPLALNWSSGDANPGSFQSEGTDKSAANNHPTVKPIALMRWLCRLVTPAGGAILDPFAGSFSTGCGAVLEGFDFTGIENEETGRFVEIGRARMAYWSKR